MTSTAPFWQGGPVNPSLVRRATSAPGVRPTSATRRLTFAPCVADRTRDVCAAPLPTGRDVCAARSTGRATLRRPFGRGPSDSSLVQRRINARRLRHTFADRTRDVKLRRSFADRTRDVSVRRAFAVGPVRRATFAACVRRPESSDGGRATFAPRVRRPDARRLRRAFADRTRRATFALRVRRVTGRDVCDRHATSVPRVRRPDARRLRVSKAARQASEGAISQ